MSIASVQDVRPRCIIKEQPVHRGVLPVYRGGTTEYLRRPEFINLEPTVSPDIAASVCWLGELHRWLHRRVLGAIVGGQMTS